MLDHASAAVLWAIRHAGFNVGESKFMRLDRGGKIVSHVDATCAATGEGWSVQAPTLHDAVVELALQVGFELEE